jgi:hypothetical protein
MYMNWPRAEKSRSFRAATRSIEKPACARYLRRTLGSENVLNPASS